MRSSLFCLVALLAACKTPVPLQASPSFVTSPSLATRNPNDIAVLPLEDATQSQDATRLLDHMRRVLGEQLISRRYAPMRAQFVDASLSGMRPGPEQSLLHPEFLRNVAGRSTGDALLAVRVEKWDEGRLLSEKYVTFQFQAALVASDGEVLWSGSLSGQAKAGGYGPAPRDRDGMARSCADVALTELLNHLQSRTP